MVAIFFNVNYHLLSIQALGDLCVKLEVQSNFFKVSLFHINVLKCMCFQSSLTVF